MENVYCNSKISNENLKLSGASESCFHLGQLAQPDLLNKKPTCTLIPTDASVPWKYAMLDGQ